MTHFITSKFGNIESLVVYEYLYTEKLKSNTTNRKKFEKWLRYNPNIHLYTTNRRGFKTFTKLDNSFDSQYFFDRSITIVAPFKNTQKISAFFSKEIRTQYEAFYEKLEHENVFVVDKLHITFFYIYKCFNFNVEFFDNGDFFIHFSTESKLTLPKVGSEFIRNKAWTNNSTLSNINTNDDNLVFTLIEPKKHKTFKVNINDKVSLDSGIEFIQKHKDVNASFDYHFIASTTPNTFKKVEETTLKGINTSLELLEPIIKKLKPFHNVSFQEKPFLKVEVNNIGNNKNLLIANSLETNQKRQVTLKGFYKKSNLSFVQPVITKDSDVHRRIEFLTNSLNQINTDLHHTSYLSEPIYLNEENEKNTLEAILKSYSRAKKINALFLVIILSDIKVKDSFLNSLKKFKIKFKILSSISDEYSIANFTVSFLKQLGAIPCILKDSRETNNTYFIGVDLGHATKEIKKHSNIGLTLFSNKGVLLHKVTIPYLTLNEKINANNLITALLWFKEKILKLKLPLPEKLIFHRDGRFYDGETELFKHVTFNVFLIENIELVSIIRKGIPFFIKYDKSYYTPYSGTYFALHNYALLITNTQTRNSEQVINPIIVKHVYGYNTIDNIIWQVYWLCHLENNSLFNISKTPCTVNIASRIAYTGDKEKGKKLKNNPKKDGNKYRV